MAADNGANIRARAHSPLRCARNSRPPRNSFSHNVKLSGAST